MVEQMDLGRLELALRECWSEETCDPANLGEWSVDNPSRGQCGVTSLIVYELVGGDLMLGEVRVDGEQEGWHYWNRLPSGIEIDLTSEQFGDEEKVVNGKPVVVPPGAPRRCREQYELLRTRVHARLESAVGRDPDK